MATLIREIEEPQQTLDPRYLREEPLPDEDAISEPEIELDPDDAAFVDSLVLRCIVFTEEFCDVSMFPYQREIAYRIIESIVIGDGEEITVLQARQSGKTEVLANVIASMMVLLPRLAKVYPSLLGKFAKGFWVGCFAPTDEQADTVWGRIVDRLTSDKATDMLCDPELSEKVSKEGGKSKCVTLRNSKSLCRRQTCNPRARIESKTYHMVLVDECFPAETPVLTADGWVAIGDIVNGDRRDWVVATQEADGTLGWGRVTTGYRTPRHTPLVRVDHEHGTVYATANHPFMVDGRRVPAISLTTGTLLSVVPGAPQPRGRAGQEGADAVLQQHLPGAIPQSDERPRGPLSDGSNTAGDWAPPQGAGRQWSRDDRATAEALGRAWDGLGSRACVPHWREAQGRSPVALQDRPGASAMEVGRGAGRGIAWDVGTTGTGSSEDGMAQQSRVVRVEVLEPGSAEFSQFSDGADFVYTLEVDSESHTYVAGGVLVGNCQDADTHVVEKSIGPMLAFSNGTRVYTGTPNRTKNIFYKAIQHNKRRQTRRGMRQNHFEFNYKFVCRYNENYRKFIAKEKARLGEDSDEFQMSYNCKWMLEQGMFVAEDALDALGDPGMKLYRTWYRDPVVVGVDPARTKDSTVVTVVWVDWNRPDAFGFFEHRVLNWLEITNKRWEEQYLEIAQFLAGYNVLRIGVDTTGMGSAVHDRLRVMFPDVDVIECPSDAKTQGERWKHLKSIIERQALIYPAHSTVRRTRCFRRFKQQMVDLETKMQGPYMLAAAPDENEAHDDYPDSLAIACAMTLVDTMEEGESVDSPFVSKRR